MSAHGGPPQRGDLYRHWKQGHLYLVLHLISDVTTEAMTPMVVYLSIETGQVHCRTAEDFKARAVDRSVPLGAEVKRPRRFEFVRQAPDLLTLS